MSKSEYMLEYKQRQQRRQTQRVIFSLPVLGVLGILTVMMIIGAWNIHVKARNTQENLDHIAGVYEGLHAREVDLEDRVDGLKTPFGVEAEIRNKFGLTRQGEEVVVIVDESLEKSENQDSERGRSWWQGIKDIF
jgi:cell division protein FtsB